MNDVASMCFVLLTVGVESELAGTCDCKSFCENTDKGETAEDSIPAEEGEVAEGAVSAEEGESEPVNEQKLTQNTEEGEVAE